MDAHAFLMKHLSESGILRRVIVIGQMASNDLRKVLELGCQIGKKAHHQFGAGGSVNRVVINDIDARAKRSLKSKPGKQNFSSALTRCRRFSAAHEAVLFNRAACAMADTSELDLASNSSATIARKAGAVSGFSRA